MNGSYSSCCDHGRSMPLRNNFAVSVPKAGTSRSSSSLAMRVLNLEVG